jgi:hypothetical protein
MSSSRSGQWMPVPGPINRQCSRSAAVPCISRGNIVRGISMARPSTNRANIVRSSKTTSAIRSNGARAAGDFLGEKLIPCPPQPNDVCPDYRDDLPGLSGAEAVVVSHPRRRIEPELCLFVISVYMNVPRLVPIGGVKIEAVRPDFEDRWHEANPRVIVRKPRRRPLARAIPHRGPLRGISRESSRSLRLRGGRPVRDRRLRRSCLRRGCGRSRA